MEIRKQDALNYHSSGRKGKIEVISSKPVSTQWDLSLAYSPGVAVPCLEIEKDPSLAYEYTAKGNLVAVISNGTAVLGLGDIGAIAGKPVMEGKGVLFKTFADIDVFDIEVNTKDPEVFVETVKLLEPTFGGINLEDIKAPECFYIEERLKKEMNIPVFHDDQHGTAIISGAALINAVYLQRKELSNIKIVVCGAGASGIACSRLYVSLGVKRENIYLVDTKGVIYKGRKEGMNKYKEEFANDTHLRTFEEVLKGADVFCGLSSGGMVTKEMVKTMADNPIIMAMANPDPEISPKDVMCVRKDAIIATGRSDYPNQVNNVLGFPSIFRGALDVSATTINEEMKLAAVYSLAELARDVVPDNVVKAYGGHKMHFGKEYIIPKPFDPRVLVRVAYAVAKAAIDSGVAKKSIDPEVYKEILAEKIDKARETMRVIYHKARSKPRRIVFGEGDNQNVLEAVNIVINERIAHPILLGNKELIEKKIKELDIKLPANKFDIVDPRNNSLIEQYTKEYFKLRQRHGVTMNLAKRRMIHRRYFAPMMLQQGDADGLLCGITRNFVRSVRPILQIIKPREGIKDVSALVIIVIKNKMYFLADVGFIENPTVEQLASITFCSANVAKAFNVEPRVALLSFNNFGDGFDIETSVKMAKAVEYIREKQPNLIVDGELQADIALSQDILSSTYPFSKLNGKPANILIFPNLAAGNITYKLMSKIGGAQYIGPILLGLSKSAHILQYHTSVQEIVHMTATCVVDSNSEMYV